MTITVEYSVEPSKAEARHGDQLIEWRSKEADFSATNGDFALFAFLPKAMRMGKNIHIAGRVDRQALRNAWLLSHFWSQWDPAHYRPVGISADEITDASGSGAANQYAICLSGGVDSTFALLSGLAGLHPEAGMNITMGVFVHGFDYPPDNVDGYSKVLQSIRQAVHEFGIQAVPVDTNWKQEICGWAANGWGWADWHDFHTVGLASVLHLFGGSFRGGIIAADNTFREDHVRAPWSNSAITNRLCASGQFDIQPIGEHDNRIEKIRVIHELGKLPLVKVCWEGPKTGDNCSRCEKCLRTMLTCEALGIDPKPAFHRPLVAKEISGMHMPSPMRIERIQQVLDLPGNRLSKPLRRAAKLAILKSRLRNQSKPLVDALRSLRNSKA